MGSNADEEIRVCNSEISLIEYPVVFKGKNYVLNVLKTAYGDFLQGSTKLSCVLTGKPEKAAKDHFLKVANRCKSLLHNDANLNDNIKALNQLSYLYRGCIYLTAAGVERFAQESQNTEAIQNKEELLGLIKSAYEALRATTTVDTSKPYAAFKKARRDDGAAAATTEEVDDVVVFRKQRDELELVMPLVRAKNAEELGHIQRVNEEIRLRDAAALQHREAILAKEREDVERIKMLNDAILQHGDKLIDQEERKFKSKLAMEREQLKLDHERRLATDPAYIEATLQAEAEARRISDAADALKLVETKRQLAEAAEAAATAAKKLANAERARKSSETRKKHKMAETRQSLLRQYTKATPQERLLIEPELLPLLRDEYPDVSARDEFLRKLVMAGVKTDDEEPPQAAGVEEGVYVLELEGLPYRYYVGSSKNVAKRITAHQAGKGAVSTKRATKIRRVPTQTQPIDGDLDASERREVLYQMHARGIDMVRGWLYSSVDLSGQQRKDAISNVCSWKGLCGKCGSSGHFILECTSADKAAWMCA